MDKRLTRGIVLAIIGGAMVWYGKGILQQTLDDRVAGNMMIVSLVLGGFIALLALASLYDFVTRPPEHDYY